MYRVIVVCSFYLVLSGCSIANPAIGQQSTGVRMANPAVTKCVAEGLKVEPQVINGVPDAYFCIDVKNGARCEAWAYFRGECALTNNTVRGR